MAAYCKTEKLYERHADFLGKSCRLFPQPDRRSPGNTGKVSEMETECRVKQRNKYKKKPRGVYTGREKWHR
ncbi:UNVERIFIED_ORG: hypothetical protein B5F06_09325 [Lacrimispora saccharolytica]